MSKNFFLLLIIASNLSAGILWYAGHVVVGTIKTTAWAGSTVLLVAGTAGTYYVAENYNKFVAQGAQTLLEEPDKLANIIRFLDNFGLSMVDIAKVALKIPEGKKICYLTTGVLAAASLYAGGKTVKSAFRTIIPNNLTN